MGFISLKLCLSDCGAPAVQAGLQWQICLVYLDDVKLYSQDVRSNIARLHVLLQKLREAGLTLRPKKCHLFKEQILYLGRIVGGEGIATYPDKTKAVQEWRTPRGPD